MGVASFFGCSHSILGVSVLAVFYLLAFDDIFDVEDLFLRCLEIRGLPYRKSCIKDSILSGMSGTLTICSGMIS